MTILNEGIHTGEFLLSEANGSLSREEVTVVSGAAMVSGTVLGKVTASGKYAAYNNGASDGSEVAKAVLYNGLAASGSDRKAVVIVRQAEVAAARLTGNDSSGTTDLLAQTIIVR